MHTDGSCAALDRMLENEDLEDVWSATMAIVTCGCTPGTTRFTAAQDSTSETVITLLEESARRCDRDGA
jgi:hypothetical protein